MEMNFISEEQYYLEKLSRYLNYELSTSVLNFLSFAWGITLVLALIAALIFAPYMLFYFIKIRKYSWIVIFCIIVVIPLILCLIIGIQLDNLSGLMLMLIPLGFFYFYCFVIKLMVKDQIKELIAKDELDKAREEEKEQLFLSQHYKSL
ncbi:MAG: hypothetical protein WB996_08510 [Ignavibacteriaceae bacterium]